MCSFRSNATSESFLFGFVGALEGGSPNGQGRGTGSGRPEEDLHTFVVGGVEAVVTIMESSETHEKRGYANLRARFPGGVVTAQCHRVLMEADGD